MSSSNQTVWKALADLVRTERRGQHIVYSLNVTVLDGAALIPVVYSYFVYRGLEGFGPDPEINEDTDLGP